MIDLLGLTQHRHKMVGDAERRGLSGGQRKRVNVGLELVADPSLVFLDEPTSGLDSTAALDLMQCLHRLSRFGVAVCAVLHQPRMQVFELAHSLLLLGPSGRTVYMGPTHQVKAYFEALRYQFDPRENIADLLLDIVSGVLTPTRLPAQPHLHPATSPPAALSPCHPVTLSSVTPPLALTQAHSHLRAAARSLT